MAELPGRNRLSFDLYQARYVIQRKGTDGYWYDHETFANMQALLDWLWLTRRPQRHPIFGDQEGA